MYLTYWKLKEKPFENTPNPKFLYHSSEHDEAYIRLLYCIKNLKGAAMLTGEYGCGKTLLMHTLVQKLSKEKYNIAYLTNPRWTALELIEEILFQLNIKKKSNERLDLLHSLNSYLINSFQQDRHTLIIIDESQVIANKETFDELRMLLNFQFNDRFLITLFLVGQPELKDQIKELPQLDQRIAVRYHLKKFDLNDTKNYINFRLAKAQAENTIFTDGAINLIQKYSEGTPRRINNICDLSLLLGFGQKLDLIDEQHVQSIINSEG
eukprot:Anaeramoba_ignava/a219027_15.p2 GENE.a219027_15~~a219027_15.p2  ORF type:complete len:266 (+),score=26.10 a219027_15:186-983(+)